MEYKEKEIKTGIKLHTINTNKFKTNLMAIFLTTKLSRENVTKTGLIPTILRRGSKNMKTQEEISKQLENMYGAAFDCGLDKTGDNQVLKFYIEAINDKFLPKPEENLLKTSLEKLFEIVFNPDTEENGFKKEYVEQEKQNMKHRIEAKVDNKARYSLDRCVEEMYPNEPFGLYKFGYVEDLEKIDNENLYEYYKEFINNCKIDIFISGDIQQDLENIILENENVKKLESRTPDYVRPKMETGKVTGKEKVVIENKEVTQGKLVIGLDMHLEEEKLKYVALVYNSLLGGSANSKLFQNVREKANLAYAASSTYLRHKNNIFINCGIEIENYEKALEIIKQQIEAMKNGDFTEEEIENNKKGIIATIKTIPDEQDTQITYYFGQELSQNKITEEEYEERIKNVTKDEVVEIAQKVQINTIYFLRD